MKNILFILVLVSSLGYSQTVTDLFEKGNSSYKNGDYKTAITLYRSIEAQNKVSSELYFNLGNCYYKLNKVAPTIYNYEKALRLDPNNEDARNNLIFAKRLTLDRIEKLPQSVFQKLQASLFVIDYASWGYFSILFSVFTALLFLGYYFSLTSSNKRLFFSSGIITALLLICSFSIAYTQYQSLMNKKEAIIFSEEAIVKTEPTVNSDESFVLHEGTKVVLLDTVDDWKKIKLVDGKIGWLPSLNLKEL